MSTDPLGNSKSTYTLEEYYKDRIAWLEKDFEERLRSREATFENWRAAHDKLTGEKAAIQNELFFYRGSVSDLKSFITLCIVVVAYIAFAVAMGWALRNFNVLNVSDKVQIVVGLAAVLTAAYKSSRWWYDYPESSYLKSLERRKKERAIRDASS